MDESLTFTVRIFFALWLLAAGIVCSFLAPKQPIPIRRRQMWFVATAFFGIFFVVVGVANYLQPNDSQTFEADGVIVVATPYGAGTEIQVRLAGGGVAHVNADGNSKFFRVGQRIKAKYEAYSGTIQDAQFFAADGTLEGEFHASNHRTPYVTGGIGLTIIGFGWWNYWRQQRKQSIG